jgi:hypothetical protein
VGDDRVRNVKRDRDNELVQRVGRDKKKRKPVRSAARSTAEFQSETQRLRNERRDARTERDIRDLRERIQPNPPVLGRQKRKRISR